MSQEQIDKRVVVTSIKRSLAYDAARIKVLRKQIIAYEKDKKSVFGTKREHLDNLSNQAYEEIQKIIEKAQILTTELIRLAPKSKKAEKVVRKLGYESVEGYLSVHKDTRSTEIARRAAFTYKQPPTNSYSVYERSSNISELSEMFLKPTAKVIEQARKPLNK